MSFPSYPKIYNLGHPAISDLFKEEVTVEEKVDGSQFSFTKTKTDEVICASKSVSPPDKMFDAAGLPRLTGVVQRTINEEAVQ